MSLKGETNFGFVVDVVVIAARLLPQDHSLAQRNGTDSMFC